MRTTETHASPLQRGQRLTLTLGRLNAHGECIADVDGFAVHVFGGVPGEQVVAEVARCFRERAVARVVEVLTPSPERVAPPCPYFWPCTGCQWQHIRYDHQLALKQGAIAEALAPQIGPTLRALPLWPTLPSPQLLGYRNHARFTVGPAGAVGFVNSATRNFVHVGRCLLMHPAINQTLGALQGNSAETSQVSVRYGENTSELLVQPKLKSTAVAVPTGQETYHEELFGRSLRVASPSFFQVNTQQTERLIHLLRAQLSPRKDEMLVDAYAGVGTFSVLLAPFVRRVVGIEESASAIKDAQENARDLPNVRFLLGKTEAVLAGLNERPDVVVLDPPRTGCHPDALAAVISQAPAKVVYVSCEPETLARDLNALLAGPYRLAALYPVDMFPQTHHVECVAVLLHGKRVTNGVQLTLASASPRRRELLQVMGLPFTVMPPHGDEEGAQQGDDPKEYVVRLATAKAREVAGRLHEGVILGADTIVVSDGRVFGKPASAAEAKTMLAELRGRTHAVFTGVAVVDAGSGRLRTAVQESAVTMRDFTDAEIEAYVATGNPLDKAGAYAVQDSDFRPARRVEGCYFNVVGLPLCTLGLLLREFGLETVLPLVGRADGCSICWLWGPPAPESTP